MFVIGIACALFSILFYNIFNWHRVLHLLIFKKLMSRRCLLFLCCFIQYLSYFKHMLYIIWRNLLYEEGLVFRPDDWTITRMSFDKLFEDASGIELGRPYWEFLSWPKIYSLLFLMIWNIKYKMYLYFIFPGSTLPSTTRMYQYLAVEVSNISVYFKIQ